MLAVIVVAFFAIAGLDPYMQLLLWVNSPGVLGILVLQVLTCLAVVVFFVRNRDVPRRWFVIPAAVVAGLAMTGVLWVLYASLETLTAGGPVVNAIVIASIPVTFIVGVVLAKVWKRTRPEVYAKIGGASEFSEVDR